MGTGLWRCLAGDLEILVHRGQVYLPLLMDPDIHRELQTPSSSAQVHEADTEPSPALSPAVLEVQGRLFLQAVKASSLVENFAGVFPGALAERRQTLLEKYSLTADLWGLSVDPQLITIVFHILPHFLRRKGLRKPRRLREVDVLDHLRERLPAPRRYLQEARKYQNLTSLEEALRRLETGPAETEPLPEGLVPAARVRAWWEETLTARLLAEIRVRLLRELQDRERWAAAQEEHLALLLSLADQGSLELDGFGFARLGKGREYRVYKRTGAFALQDFYGRLYLFPDCRVAVTTSGRLRPVVVDHYKHPFLRRHGSGQEICVGSDIPRLTFSAKNAIQTLEEGVNTLLYSYDTRRRKGYHRLDVLPGMMRLVDFEDYRIPPDHPLIVSGQVEVKNRAT